MADTASVIALTVPNNPNPDTARSEARGYCTPFDPPAALLKPFAFPAQVRGAASLWPHWGHATGGICHALTLPSFISPVSRPPRLGSGRAVVSAVARRARPAASLAARSEEHTSELQSRRD